MFSGDLLFAGSIGRTDLPGGDHPTMLRSLATKVLPLRDDIVVLPGHGEQTSIARERATNPYLLDLVRDPGESTPSPPEASRTDEQTHPLSGFPELLPEQKFVEQRVTDSLRRTFELHGFAPVETRAVEPSTTCCARARPPRRSMSCAGCRPTRSRRTPTRASACTST